MIWTAKHPQAHPDMLGFIPSFLNLDDGNTVRFLQVLKRQGIRWFFANGSMGVIYTPTHWRTK